MDGKRGQSLFHLRTSMKSTRIDMLAKTRKKARRGDHQHGKLAFVVSLNKNLYLISCRLRQRWLGRAGLGPWA